MLNVLEHDSNNVSADDFLLVSDDNANGLESRVFGAWGKSCKSLLSTAVVQFRRNQLFLHGIVAGSAVG
jgi:hypothetical protein